MLIKWLLALQHCPCIPLLLHHKGICIAHACQCSSITGLRIIEVQLQLVYCCGSEEEALCIQIALWFRSSTPVFHPDSKVPTSAVQHLKHASLVLHDTVYVRSR